MKYPDCDLFCAKFLEDAMDHAVESKVAGVLLEPLQANGGHVFPPKGYLKRLREICTKRDVPLIYDEIQTGLGRCGEWFASEVFEAYPDILVVGKGLGGGFPITGIITSEKYDLFDPGDWGSTNGGNPLSCAAALATIRVIEEEGLIENARKVGKVFKDRMNELMKRVNPMTAKKIVEKALEKGVIIAKSGIGEVGNVLKIKPPLIMSVSEMEKVLEVLESCFKEIAQGE
jgi:acetylornithine/N-succinyldiaminopimelate aminotransferase